MLFPQPAHHWRQDHVGCALERADIDPAVASLEPVERSRQRGRLRQQVAPVGQDQSAERGDPHPLRPGRPVEHCPADGLLQCSDLLADCRLAVAQPGGGPAERALIGDGGHGGEMPQLGIGHGSQPSQEHRLLRLI